MHIASTATGLVMKQVATIHLSNNVLYTMISEFLGIAPVNNCNQTNQVLAVIANSIKLRV